MAETDHVHEKGVPASGVGGTFTEYWCTPCVNWHRGDWWDGYEQAVADAAHGLPGHKARLEAVKLTLPSVVTVDGEDLIDLAVNRYLAGTKGPRES